MIRQFKDILLGVNAAAVVRGLRFGPGDFYHCCQRSLEVTHPREDRLMAILPQICLTNIISDRDFPVRLMIDHHVDGTLPSYQAFILVSLLAIEAPREVLEIGTFMGHTTKLMAENLEHSTIHTVDLPLDYSLNETAKADVSKDDFHLIRDRQVGREFRDTPYASRIVQHYADTMAWDFVGVGHPTFFFIDGSHTYEACRNDSDKCYALCGGKGVFLWHDCDQYHTGVIRAMGEWRKMGRDVRRIRGTSLGYWKGT
jgi:Methyltransferase domain